MCEASASFDVLIVGGGQAGVQVASSLRSIGYEGSIGLVDAGSLPPYERPPLTKGYLKGLVAEQDLLLRPADFWVSADVCLVLGVRIDRIDVTGKMVHADTGLTFGYRHLVWAAGGRARELPAARGLAGVHTVRTLDDAHRLRSEVEDAQHVVVVGGGFIGLEAASVLRESGLTATILEAQERLLARVTAPPVSEFFLQLHRRRGSEVVLNAVVDRVDSHGGRVSRVMMGDGRGTPADIIIVGIGLEPTIGPLRDAGVACSNGVDVDAWCRTSAPDVFAAGDCANRPSRFSDGRPVRLESVPNAVEQGKIVASAITGAVERTEGVPWFWSHQYDVRLQTVGLFNDHNALVVRGDPGAGSFSVVYLRRDGTVSALDCVNATKDFAQGKALVKAGVQGDPRVLADPAVPLKVLLDAASVERDRSMLRS